MRSWICLLTGTWLALATGAQANGVLRLDGNGDHVRIEHPYFHQQFTIEMEVNSSLQFSSGSEDFGGLVAYTNQQQEAWATNLDRNGCAVLNVNFGQGNLIGLNDGCAVLANTWTHLAFVYDAASGIHIYRDGVLVNQSSNAVPVLDIAGGFTEIGLNPAQSDEYFVGMIDEVRVWSVARTAAQIEGGLCSVDPASPGLAGYWKFDDIGSLTATDASPAAQHGALLGDAEQIARPVDPPAGVNGVLQLNGNGDFVRIDHPYNLDELTVEMQVRSPLQFPNGNEDFGGLVACSSEQSAVWETNLDEQGCAVLVLNFGQENMAQQSDGCTVPANRWTHLAFVYGADRVIRIYVDGILKSELAAGVPLSAIQDAYTVIGLNPAINDEYYTGLIDEVRIWNHARSAAEIAASPCSVNPAAPGLVGYWKFDQIGSCTAFDSSPGLHHGELRGQAAQIPGVVLDTDFSVDLTSLPRGGQVQFSDLTTGGPIESWQWQFGDGGSSQEQNPVHVYQQVGLYDVTLTTSSLCGSSSYTRRELIQVLDVCEACWFHEDWESGQIDPLAWKSFGDPDPLLVGDPCGAGLAFDPNGDDSYESGVASREAYDLGLRPQLSFRATGSTGDGMRSLRVGWARTAADAYNDPPDMPAEELATISVIPQSGYELISYGLSGDGFQEPWDPAWNGQCLDFSIVINLDGTVSFYRGGVLKHRTSTALELGQWSNQALVVFGRSTVLADEISVTPPSAEPEQFLFAENWEGGGINADIWKCFGSPASQLVTPGHESATAFDCNGDGDYESGVASWQAYDLQTAPAVSFWARGNMGAGHHSVRVAWAETTAAAYNEPPDAPASELAGISLIPQDGYRIISYGLPGDGFQEAWNPLWNNQWQHFMMRVNEDGTVTFYRNGHVRHHSSQALDLSQWTQQALVILGRQGVLVDDLAISTGNPSLGAVDDLAIAYDPQGQYVQLSWSPVPFATGYKVYRLPALDAVRSEELVVSTQCTTGFRDSVAENEMAIYVVVAVWE